MINFSYLFVNLFFYVSTTNETFWLAIEPGSLYRIVLRKCIPISLSTSAECVQFSSVAVLQVASRIWFDHNFLVIMSLILISYLCILVYKTIAHFLIICSSEEKVNNGGEILAGSSPIVLYFCFKSKCKFTSKKKI